MTDEKHNAGTTQRLWTSHGAQLLGTSESAVLMLIGVALVLVAVLLPIRACMTFTKPFIAGREKSSTKRLRF